MEDRSLKRWKNTEKEEWKSNKKAMVFFYIFVGVNIPTFINNNIWHRLLLFPKGQEITHLKLW